MPLLLTLALACTDPGASGEARRDTPIAVSPVVATVPTADDSALRWSADVRLSLGTDSGDVHQEFNRIGAVDVDARGAIYVLDLGARRVRKFDGNGMFIAEFGSDGGGPGEFAPGPSGFPGTIGGMAVVGDSILVLQDPWDWTFTVLGLDGSARKDVPLRFATPDRFVARSAVALFDAGNGAVVLHFRYPFAIGPARTPSDGSESLLRVPLDASRADTLLAFRPRHEVAVALDARRGEIFGLPFAPRQLWAIGHDGRLAIAQGDAFAVEVTDGSATRRLQFAAPRLPVSVADVSRFRSAFPFGEGMSELAPVARQVAESVLRSIDFPDSLPAIDDLRFDRTGRLWVRRYPAPDAVDARWDVFSAALEFVGSVRLPKTLRVHRIDEHEILATVRDDDDVPYVKVLRLRPVGAR